MEQKPKQLKVTMMGIPNYQSKATEEEVTSNANTETESDRSDSEDSQTS